MAGSTQIEILLMFHHRKEDQDYIHDQINERGCLFNLVVSSDPDALIPDHMMMDNERSAVRRIEYIAFSMSVIDSLSMGCSNQLLVTLLEEIEGISKSRDSDVKLLIDMFGADKKDAFATAKLSALYPSEFQDGADKKYFSPVPDPVELNDREQDLLISFYRNKRAFSKTEVLEEFHSFNSNKYQASKDKLERSGMILLVVPPINREIRVGKNPDYYAVTFSGYYNALLSKRADALKAAGFGKKKAYPIYLPVEVGEYDISEDQMRRVYPYLTYDN